MTVLLIIIPLIFISTIPSLAIIWVVNKCLKHTKIPLKTFAFVSMLLAFQTGYSLKIEFENGLESLPYQLAGHSTVWVCILIIVFLMGNFILNMKKV